VLAAVLFALSASAQTYALNNVPNPRVADGGFVTDPEGLLGSARGVIDARLRALEQRSGAEIALVILPSIGDAVPKQFATALFEAWGIGKKQVDNGVLILHVLDQRRVEIETGYGVEGALPDVKCHWLIDEVVVPAFKRAQFATGHDALTRGLVYGLEHPEAGRDELLQSAALTGEFANVPAPKLAFSARPAAPARTDAGPALLSRLLPTPFHVLPMVGLFLLGWRRRRVHHALYPNSRKRPPAKTEILSVLVSVLWIGAVIGAAVAQAVWVHHVAALLVLGSCALVFGDCRLTARRAAERNAPRACRRCATALTRVRDGDAEQLEQWQAVEERLGAFDYDVWSCACGERLVLCYDGATPRAACSACHHHTTTRERVVTQAPTLHSTGDATVTTHCEFCEHDVVEHEIIPRLDPPSSSSSSGGAGRSSSGSSSFGGGRSGGGGSGGSY
jgi:uncharacterized protein